jgi:hypothetical protein
MKQLLALTMIAFLLPATAAMAKGPCKDDKEKFCKGEEKAGACLRQHMDELSATCKEKLSKSGGAKDAKPEGAKTEGAKTEEKPAEAKTEAPATGAAPSEGTSSKE